MARPALIELVVRTDWTSGDDTLMTWTLQHAPVYPDPPGRRSAARELGAHTAIVTHSSPDDRDGGAGLQRALGDPKVAEMLGRIDDARRGGAWARITVDARALWEWTVESWPWEDVFADRGLAVVRRMKAGPSRPAPRFPLRCYTMRARGSEPETLPLLEDALSEPVRSGALQFSRHPAGADIVTVLGGRIGWRALDRLAHVRPRLIVVARDAHHAEPRSHGSKLLALGAAAVLELPPCQRWSEDVLEVHRGILEGVPLDMLVARLRHHTAAILYCEPDGEQCVSLSKILDGALRITEGGPAEAAQIEVTGAADADPVTAAWIETLGQPLAEVISAADALTFQAGADTGGERRWIATTLVEQDARTRALVAERAAVQSVIRALVERGPQAAAEASARMMQASIVDHEVGLVPAASGLRVDWPYAIRIQIVRAAERTAWSLAAVPEQALRETFARVASEQLTVMLYTDTHAVRLPVARETLRVPRLGDSAPLEFEFSLRKPGPFAIRAGLFHGTALLQTVLIRGTAGTPDAHVVSTSELDFAASSHLMLLDAHEQPDVTIWTNQALEGTHWIGVFTGEAGVAGLTSGFVELSSHDLAQVAAALQRALLDAELDRAGSRQRYRFDAPCDAGARRARGEMLVRLARAGWEAYAALFDRTQEQSPAASTREALVSIARCRPDRTNLPWAALYDYHLDGEALSLCPVFEATIGTAAPHEDPARCRARADCPLSDPERGSRTVCPFGFWGIRHRIEQPIAHLRTEVGTYDELQRAAGHKPVIGRRQHPPRIAIAEGPGFDERAARHLDAVARLTASERSSLRPEVLDLLARADQDIYYFFCHGVAEQLGVRLRLRPGPDDVQHGDISAADLLHQRYAWAPAMAPLVFLNGCDTVAFKAETLNRLLDRLRAMGAAGVIGTEIPVHTYLAEEVGMRVLEALLAGSSLGDAFLGMRRALLRAQCNPLGLAYSFFASARLHLCGGEACASCAATAAHITRHELGGKT